MYQKKFNLEDSSLDRTWNSLTVFFHKVILAIYKPEHKYTRQELSLIHILKTDFIARGGDRVGIYYLETGASMRPSKVIYDRAPSAIAAADAADFDLSLIHI